MLSGGCIDAVGLDEVDPAHVRLLIEHPSTILQRLSVGRRHDEFLPLRQRTTQLDKKDGLTEPNRKLWTRLHFTSHVEIFGQKNWELLTVEKRAKD